MAAQRTILITGATGFIGSSVAAGILLANPHDRLIFLVRAADRGVARRRVLSTLRRFDIPDGVIGAIGENQVLCGELGNAQDWAGKPVVRSVTHVFNCAAHASFGQDHTVWQINYRDTFDFLQRMLRAPRLERLIHVGTAMCCGPLRGPLVAESWDSAPRSEHYVGYTASKAALDGRIHAELPDPRLVVARPSIVIGHTRLGCRPSGSLFWIFRIAREIGRFTCTLDDRIDVIPVDHCASALVHLAFKPRLAHALYHVSAGISRSCTYGEIDREYAKALGAAPLASGYQQIRPREMWKLVAAAAPTLGIGSVRLAASALSLYGAFASLSYSFDNTRLVAEGVAEPPRFTEYLERCVRTSLNVPVEDQMRFDVKRPSDVAPIQAPVA